MKSIWNGALAFGLVSIPVQLYSVAQQHALGFRMLCKTCNRPIRLKRWCDHCKKEVTWDNVVKGLEISKGHYFVLTKEKLRSLKPSRTPDISVSSFVDIQLIDPVYINTHYYVVPADKHKAYTLFQYALGSAGKVAIGSFVMRDREQLCMIQSYRLGLLMTTLYYSDEVRAVESIQEFKGKQETVSSGELKLAKQLIDQLTEKKFDISDYKDTFALELKKLIKQKKAGKIVDIEAAPKTRSKTKEKASLTDILKASLKEKRSSARK